MTKDLIASNSASLQPLSHSSGNVVAIVIGIELYQTRAEGALTNVEYAENDARRFSEVIEEIYGDALDVTLLLNSDATISNIDYALLNSIGSLNENDTFIFYYAGHGFHDADGNRVTAWDSNAFHIQGTTLSLREKLISRLSESPCKRSLSFVDACATKFKQLVQARDVISDFDPTELREFLDATEYSALFLSCSPGEQSYPSSELKHGVWTYFLLEALSGNSDEALGPGRHLTDSGLKNYLRREVQRYDTRRTKRTKLQTPYSVISANGTFSIREVPEPQALTPIAGDFRAIKVTPTEEFFEGIVEGEIRSLSKFNKRSHRVPDYISVSTGSFLCTLIEEEINSDIQEHYVAVKQLFGLRRKDIASESAEGQGSIDTSFFRYSVNTSQIKSDPGRYKIVRRLSVRADPSQYMDKIDELFGPVFTDIVVKIDANELDYDTLVDTFEDMELQSLGVLNEHPDAMRMTFSSDHGMRISIDLGRGRISLTTGKASLPSNLLSKARSYRFGLSQNSNLLLR